MSLRTRISLFCGVFAVSMVSATLSVHTAALRHDDLCGATILEDLTLDHDLACTGAGLIVGADDITVNLNGHTISGSGTGVGIRIALRSGVSVKGGTVRGFETGIMVANSSHVTIKDNAVTGTREGIFLNGSSDCDLKGNVAWLNQIRGIMIRPSSTQISTRNEIKDNTLTDNPVGILLFGQPGNTFKANTISGSTTAGVLLTGAGASLNEFKENAISGSAVAISFGPGYVGNTFKENTFAANTCGLQGVTAGNVFRENTFTLNGADACS